MQNYRSVCISFVALMLISVPAFASDRAALVELATDATWLKLGHYEKAIGAHSGWVSAVHSDDFFLSPDGKSNPLAELDATLNAFRYQASENPDDDARCRFPARYQWLKTKLKDLPGGIACPAYDAWTRAGSVESLSVVFATGYLGNPASYYGHTLLKFNFRDQQEHTRLLDVSVNYGAITNKTDSAVTYIVKSVMGGYDGGFSHINFYFHDHNYGDIELRDLWEYRLNLPEPAVDMIVAHSWEVLGKRYTYHFFRENCAFRMAELLQIVDGVDVVPERWPWLIPQAMIEKIGSSEYQGEPLLGGVDYLPSRQSRFYNRYRNLNDNEKEVMRTLITKNAGYQSESFALMSLDSKQRILDALLDYYQFIGAPMEIAPAATKEAYFNALSQRYQLPPGVISVSETIPMAPHLTRPLGYVSGNLSHISDGSSAISLRIRPAYYDALDSEGGQVPNAELIMGDTWVDVRHGSVSLQKMDIVGVESANAGLTGLPGDAHSAWKIHAGLEREKPALYSPLVGRLQGDWGYGMNLTKRIFSAVYVGAALQNNASDYGIGYAKLSINLIYRANDALGLLLTHEQRRPFDDKKSAYGVSEFEGRLALGRTSDIRLRYQHDEVEQFGLGLGWYW